MLDADCNSSETRQNLKDKAVLAKSPSSQLGDSWRISDLDSSPTFSTKIHEIKVLIN